MNGLTPRDLIRAVRDARIAYEVAIRTEQHLRQRGCRCSDPGRVDRARARYWAMVRASSTAQAASSSEADRLRSLREVWP